MAKLVGIDGYAVNLEIPVGDVGLLIGRDSPDTTRLRGDGLLSKQHAQVGWAADGSLLIRDLGSTNGTVVNGVRVATARLSAGDRIEVGSSVFRVETVAATPPQQAGASAAQVQIAGGLSAGTGGVAVGGDAGDVYSSSAHVGGDGFAVGGNYVEGDTLEVDLTGFRTARGIARVLLIVGTLIALVGFGLFGYMMIDAFGSFQDLMAQGAECDRNFPLGPDRVECHLNLGSPEIAFVPYGAAGLAVMFAGMVVSTIGTMMNRNTDRREERALERARRRARLER